MAPDGRLRSDNRRALLAVYAVLDQTGKRADALRQLGVEFDGPLEPYSQLQKAAKNLHQSEGPLEPYSQTAENRDQRDIPIHRIHLAGAVMNVLRDPRFAPQADDACPDDLWPVLYQLVAPGYRDNTETINQVYSLMKGASSQPRFHQRWEQVNQPAEDDSSPLHPTLSDIKSSQVSIIQEPRINTGMFSVDGEAVSRIETSFVVKRPDLELRKIAPALLPDNWSRCGDFFCSLIRVPERDGDEPDYTGGDLTADSTHWCGVYQEKVGGCPGGWFPDTFLVFTWDYFPQDRPRQLILRYRLAKKRNNDRTVLRIDEGYIQVDQLTDGYQVSTLKYALFDGAGGGQTIVALAPQLGWLDQSINQFGLCAELPGGGLGILPNGPSVSSRDSLGDGLQEVLRRAETHLQETATSADEQFSKIMGKVRAGTYGLNDLVGDWGDAVVRAMRDTARSLEHRIDFARESLELANELFPRRGGTRS